MLDELEFPRRCNVAAVEYLIASERIGGIRNLSAAIDVALGEYPAPHRINANNIQDLPSIKIVGKPHSDGTPHKFEVFHIFEMDDFLEPILWVAYIDGEGVMRHAALAPLLPLLSSTELRQTYTLYEHRILGDGYDKSYVGITRQGWAARWRQHLNAATNGSPYLFHEALRHINGTTITLHTVIDCGLSYEDAMAAEEEVVAARSLYPHGLNMIPGGFAGIKYLGQRGFTNIGPKRWENRSRLLREFSKHCDRTGRPNPLLTAVWKTDGYAASVICSNPNNFDLERVREARLLASFDWTTDQIAERFCCKPERVNRLIRGNTYSRVH